MAQTKLIAKTALKKLEDQLTCAICLDAFKDPKLLQCFHVFCKDCLQRLVVQDQQGQLSLCCPNCRQSTILPPTATNVSSLTPAFLIHNLLEIQDALKKIKEPENVQCEKCIKQMATCFCRICSKFICEKCLGMHNEWEELAKHEVISMELIKSNIKQLVPPKKAILYCSLHQDKELDLYCETCEDLICFHCIIKKHKGHQYDLVVDTFETHKAEMTAAVEPIENHRSLTANAKEQLSVRLQELDDQRDALKADIQRHIQRFQGLLEARKVKLFDHVDQHVERKKKNLVTQKDEVETIETQQANCLSFVKESLDTASQGEVMRLKKAIIKQVENVVDNFKPDTLSPCEHANVRFISSPEFELACQQFGKVYLDVVSPVKCYATGPGLKIAKVGERATAVLYVVNDRGKACTTPVENVTCELQSESTGKMTKCAVKKTEANQFEISYQPTIRERHQLHIKVREEHIKGSPFAVIVKLPLKKFGTLINIGGLKQPLGLTVSQSGNIIVSEFDKHCVSIFNPAGEKVKSFGSQGSGDGQFIRPAGVAVDAEDNILVVDRNNHRVQKFTSDGNFIAAVGSHGNNQLEFEFPRGIAFHPSTRKVYVADRCNQRVQILNSNLTFFSILGRVGRVGSGDGQFDYPWDVAFDSVGNVYVTDSMNHRIQVFTAKGEFLPNCIAIDSDDVVYVTEGSNHRVSIFTCDGDFLTSFGSKGTRPGQFDAPYGIAIDKNGVVCVSDQHNNRVQLFDFCVYLCNTFPTVN